jgi:hypothetical protein
LYKLFLFIVMSMLNLSMSALQTDEELAIAALFQAKHSLNYAVHAASLQLDADKLAQGVYSIDADAAEGTALQYLRANMRLDGSNRPLAGSFLQAQVVVLVFEVIDELQTYPYTYRNATYNYEVTLSKPGVVMIIRVEFPRTFAMLGPIDWSIKSCSELTGTQT